MADPYYIPTETLAPDAAIYLQVAADQVQRFAPAPDPDDVTSEELDDYETKAANAEFLVWTWLVNTTGGSTTSESVSGLSASYTQFSSIKEIVKTSMGAFFSAGVFRTVDIERA